MINKVILIGNVGKEPEIKEIEPGVLLAKIHLATNEQYKNNQGEFIRTTEWHQILLWRHLAENVKNFVKKGSKLYIEGKLRTSTWKDKEGNNKYITEIVATNMIILTDKTTVLNNECSNTNFDEINENK